MAVDFKCCFDAIVNAREDFTPKHYPFTELEKLPKEEQKKIVNHAEKRFKQSHQTMADFYGYLFEELHEYGLSQSSGVMAAAMYVIHSNALKIFPQYEVLPLPSQIELMKKAGKNAWKSSRTLYGYAMSMYLLITSMKLDQEVNLPDELSNRKGSIDSPWKSKDGEVHYRKYRKMYQSVKTLRDCDTGKITLPYYVVWTMYRPVDGFKGINRTLQSFDLWSMLTR